MFPDLQPETWRTVWVRDRMGNAERGRLERGTFPERLAVVLIVNRGDIVPQIVVQEIQCFVAELVSQIRNELCP